MYGSCMRNNTRKRPEEPATPGKFYSPLLRHRVYKQVLTTGAFLSTTDPRDTTPRPTDSVLPINDEEEEGPTSSEIPKPPSKKRKIDNSPPWKSATTQTPTSFLVDGRRKSGRTNPIPIELMSPTTNGSNGTPTRQTRSSNAKAEDNKAGRVATLKSDSRTAPNPSTLPNRRNTSQKLPARTSTPASSSKNSKSTSKRATTPTPPKQAAPKGSSKNPPLKSESKPKPSPNRPPVTYSGSRRTSARTATRIATEASAGRANKISGRPRKHDDIIFDSDGEVDAGPDWKPPKIKIRFRRTPPLTIIHPLHVPPKPKYESFEAFLDSEEVLPERKDINEPEEEAKREAEIRQQVEDACKDGVLAPERCSLLMPEEQPGPPRLYFHHDQLIAHALNFQKLMERERRYHMGLAKKLAVACAQKVQESIPKTKEEIEEEMRKETYKLYREAVVVGIRNKWALIVEVLEHHHHSLRALLSFSN